MSIISDILEELQAYYPNINILDIDIYNSEHALSISDTNSLGVFIYIPEGTGEIHVMLEDYETGKHVTNYLLEVDNSIELYEELYNCLKEALTWTSPEASAEINEILDVLSKNVVGDGL